MTQLGEKVQEVAEEPVPSHQLACQGKNSTIGRLSPSFGNLPVVEELQIFTQPNNSTVALCQPTNTMSPHQKQQGILENQTVGP